MAYKERSAETLSKYKVKEKLIYLGCLVNLNFFFLFLNSGFVAALNCSSPTPESLFDALEKELFPKKLLRPVKSFSDILNITIGMTVVGIAGVVSP